MNTEKAVQVTKPSAINLMASRMSVEPTKLFDTLKATVFKNATNEELLALVVVSNEYGLNPFLKEIYAFPSKGGGITPIVSVDGWNKMLIRQPDFDGIEFAFTESAEDASAPPVSCTATIHIKNRSHPVVITEYFDECQRNTDNWKNMPRRMLRNRTLCQASRIAFGFSGVHHEDESIDVVATVMPNEPLKKIAAPEKQLERTPQAELESVVVSAGFTFDAFQKWGDATGVVEGVDAMALFEEVPTKVCKRVLLDTAGLLKALEGAK